jgi:signal transduction histidine kinase
LVLNAIDAMPEGGTLRVHTTLDEPTSPHPELVDPELVEGQLTDGSAVRIVFSDSGVGMSPELQAQLFEPFVTTKEHGSGLGLSISYGIIEAHNGQITVTSQEGEGTTFTILLPAPARGSQD